MSLYGEKNPGSGLRLVTRLDDAGLCENVNEAVLDAATSGLVKNISIMVPGPAFAHAAERLQERTDLCLGLHVTLNAEWETVRWQPLSPPAEVGTLIDSESFFLPTPSHLHERRSSVTEMMTEIGRQLDAARRAGLDIRYLDEHMGVSWVCGLREHLANFARSEGLVDAIPISSVPRWSHVGRGSDIAEAWIKVIQSCPPGIRVLVSHVGFDREDFRCYQEPGQAEGVVATQRNAERMAWHSSSLRECIISRGIKLLRYDEVSAADPLSSGNSLE